MNPNLCRNINHRYIIGIKDEPRVLLRPIFGYACEPLVSLEEACQPLLNIVPHLSSHIFIAKQNSKNPLDNLTDNESAAIRLYTMEWYDDDDLNSNISLYLYLNESLRTTNRTLLRPWFKYLKLFLTALAKLKIKKNLTLWRGVEGDYSDYYSPGSEIIWWSISSCTTSLNILQSPLYLGDVQMRTIFLIETLNGRSVRNHSQFNDEEEILLFPGSCFQVKSRLNPSPHLHIIHLVQKIKPFHLIQPPFKGIFFIITIYFNYLLLLNFKVQISFHLHHVYSL